MGGIRDAHPIHISNFRIPGAEFASVIFGCFHRKVARYGRERGLHRSLVSFPYTDPTDSPVVIIEHDFSIVRTAHCPSDATFAIALCLPHDIIGQSLG